MLPVLAENWAARRREKFVDWILLHASVHVLAS